MLNQREAWELPSPVLRDALAAPVAEANKGPALEARVDPEPPMAEDGLASSGALLHTAKAVLFNSGSARLRSVVRDSSLVSVGFRWGSELFFEPKPFLCGSLTPCA